METRMFKVLLVDDHFDFRRILKGEFSQMLFLVVEEAATGPMDSFDG